MKMLIQYSLFLCFFIAFYLSAKLYIKEGVKYRENRLFSLLAFFSGLWSFGFWGINIQTEPEKAYIFRAIGMVGVFAYLILVQLFICRLSDSLHAYYGMISFVSVIGFVICFFIIQKEQVTYQLSDIGMTYRFKSGFWNNAYTAYSVMIAFNMLVSILYMHFRAQRKYMRVLSNKLLFAEGIVVFGMVFDTIFPLLGKPAIPGSTYGQFIAMLVMYEAICFVNHSRVTVNNMSTYVYSSLSTPVLVYDDSYRLQIMNDIAHNSIGLKDSEIGKDDIESLFSISRDDAFCFSGKNNVIDTTCYYNKLPCNLSISKIYDNYMDKIGYIITVTDLSERMEYIERLEETMQEAKNANRAKTTFLANMSHEIRTPMNAIIGFTELVLKKDISNEVREYMNGIHLSSRNLLAIINDILDITKIESGKMEIIPTEYYIADLLDDVSLIISQQAKKKGLEFVMKTEDGIPTKLYGDKVRIRGVLINILNNAVKYTKQGSVTFETKISRLSEDMVKLYFIIRDTGIGIRPEEKKNLFKSFERLDQQINQDVEGSGLGLSISKSYLDLMGGEIQVDSVYGEGSVFTVLIDQKVIDQTPLKHEFTIDKNKQEVSNTEQIVIRDTRVLLVDDNHINLQVVKGLLNSYGLMVDTESSGAAAIELCKKTRYPVIFMDQMMPEVDGITAMKQIRKLNSYYAADGEAKIIALTADAIRGARERLIEEGFDEYLGKPLNLKQLERLLLQYIPQDKITIIHPTGDTKDIGENISKKQEDTLAYLNQALPDMDVSDGLAHCGETCTDYLNVLKINYTYGNKNLEELKALLKQKDYKNYTIKVHAMKSNARGIGAKTISEMALRQEEAGKAGEYEYIDTNFHDFYTAYKKHLWDIEQVLLHYNMLENSEDKEEQNTLDEQMVTNILTNIKIHLDSFDFAKVFDILEDVKNYKLPEELEELFQKLDTLMEDLAVDEIRELIATASESEIN